MSGRTVDVGAARLLAGILCGSTHIPDSFHRGLKKSAADKSLFPSPSAHVAAFAGDPYTVCCLALNELTLPHLCFAADWHDMTSAIFDDAEHHGSHHTH
jgi:hypothetical protein